MNSQVISKSQIKLDKSSRDGEVTLLDNQSRETRNILSIVKCLSSRTQAKTVTVERARFRVTICLYRNPSDKAMSRSTLISVRM